MDNTKIADRMMFCFRMSDLHPREQIILAILAWHDGPEGAYPSIETLCAEAGGMSRARMFDTLKSLERKGRIERRRRRNRASLIRVVYGPEVPENVTSQIESRSPGEHDSEVLETKTCIKATRMNAIKGKIIGWCRHCGHDHHGGPACLACGAESSPFIVAEHECRDGTVTLPLGVVVSGLTTPEARALFLSDDGQRELQAAYESVLETAPVQH